MNGTDCTCSDCRPPAYAPRPYHRDSDEYHDRYADEIAEERGQERASRFRAMDYADRSGAHLAR